MATVGAALLAAAPVSGMDMPGGMTGGAPAAEVSIGFADYTPAQTNVLAGDTVEWTNDSARTHTVTDDFGAYDSGVLASSMKFVHEFAQPGTFTYHCRLHPYIRGEVSAWTLLLDRPAAAGHTLVAPSGRGIVVFSI